MKKYLLGLSAIVLAIGFSAFTPSKKANCSSNLIWYTVKTGSSVAAAGTPTLAQLNLTPYTDLNALGGTPGDGAVTSADFPASRLYNQTQAVTQFGCAGASFVCAVAFDPTVTTNFQVVSGTIQPITTTGIIICKIFRNTP